jgi:hypothetical protein
MGAEEAGCEGETLQVLPYAHVPVYVIFEDERRGEVLGDDSIDG